MCPQKENSLKDYKTVQRVQRVKRILRKLNSYSSTWLNNITMVSNNKQLLYVTLQTWTLMLLKPCYLYKLHFIYIWYILINFHLTKFHKSKFNYVLRKNKKRKIRNKRKEDVTKRKANFKINELHKIKFNFGRFTTTNTENG